MLYMQVISIGSTILKNKTPTINGGFQVDYCSNSIIYYFY